MGWKIFFWIYSVLTIYSFLESPTFTPSLIDMFGYPISILELVALYAFSYKRKILTHKNWRVLFWIYIGFFTLFILGEFTPIKNTFPMLQSNKFAILTGEAKVIAFIISIGLFVIISKVLKKLAYPTISKEK